MRCIQKLDGHGGGRSHGLARNIVSWLVTPLPVPGETVQARAIALEDKRRIGEAQRGSVPCGLHQALQGQDLLAAKPSNK